MTKIPDQLSTPPATLTVGALNGMAAVISWLEIATKVLSFFAVLFTVICGAITVYGHIRKLRANR